MEKCKMCFRNHCFVIYECERYYPPPPPLPDAAGFSGNIETLQMSDRTLLSWIPKIY